MIHQNNSKKISNEATLKFWVYVLGPHWRKKVWRVTERFNKKGKREECQKEILNPTKPLQNNNQEKSYKNSEYHDQTLINTIETTRNHFLNQQPAYRSKTS